MKEPLTKVISLKSSDLRHRALQQIVAEEIRDPNTKKAIVNPGDTLTTEKIAEIAAVQDEVRILNIDLAGRKSAELVLNENGESLLRVGDLLDETNHKHLTMLWTMRGNAGVVHICSNVIEKLRDRIVGRIAAEDIVDPKTGD